MKFKLLLLSISLFSISACEMVERKSVEDKDIEGKKLEVKKSPEELAEESLDDVELNIKKAKHYMKFNDYNNAKRAIATAGYILKERAVLADEGDVESLQDELADLSEEFEKKAGKKTSAKAQRSLKRIAERKAKREAEKNKKAEKRQDIADKRIALLKTKEEYNDDISTVPKAQAHVLRRFKNIMNISKSCCSSLIKHKFSEINVREDLIYKFFQDDIYSYNNIRNNCVFYKKEAIANLYYNPQNKALFNIINSAHKECVCNNKYQLVQELNAIKYITENNKDLDLSEVKYTQTDELGRKIERNVFLETELIKDNILTYCP